MNGFRRLLEMYLREGYDPSEAFQRSWIEWQYMKQDAREFYYNHTEGVQIDDEE